MATPQPADSHIVPIPDHRGDVAAGDARTVRGYDFRRPQHLSADQVRGIQGVHLIAAAALRTRLGRYLNVELDVRMDKVEELAYALLTEALPEHTYAGILDLGSLEERGMLLVELQLCLAFVDRGLGGRATTPAEPRALTPVDEVAVESVTQLILRCILDAWKSFCPLDMAVAERHTDGRKVQILGPSEAVLNVTFVVSGELGDGQIKLCLPIASLKAAIDGASQRALGLNIAPEEIQALRAAIGHSLSRVTLPVTTSVGTADVPIRNLLNLNTGDIVRLDQAADSPVVLAIAEQPAFHVKMGLQGRKKAVQILERVQSE